MMKLILVILLSVLTAAAQTDQINIPGRNVNLRLPKSAAREDRVWLELKVGALTKGTEIEARTADGRLLGVISPYGQTSRSAETVSIYTIPVPRDAFDKGRLRLRLIVDAPDRSQRAPTKRDIRSVRLKVSPAEVRLGI
jgi:hypothetical protein